MTRTIPPLGYEPTGRYCIHILFSDEPTYTMVGRDLITRTPETFASQDDAALELMRRQFSGTLPVGNTYGVSAQFRNAEGVTCYRLVSETYVKWQDEIRRAWKKARAKREARSTWRSRRGK